MKNNSKCKWTLMLFVLLGMLIFSGSTTIYAATVAKIGSKSYSSLQKAVDAVKSNQTIKLQKNISLNKPVYCKKNVKYTINLQNHTINMRYYKRTYYDKNWKMNMTEANSGSINIDAGTVLIKNGTIKTQQSNWNPVVLSVRKKGKVTLSNCKITGEMSNEGALTIRSGTYRWSKLDILSNSGILTIRGGNFIGEGTCSKIIYNSYKCTISGGHFENKYGWGGLFYSGYNVGTKKKATLDITGGTFIGTFDIGNEGDGIVGTMNMSGGSITGSITIDGRGVLNMKGGTIKGSTKNRASTILVFGTLNMNGGTIEGLANEVNAKAISVYGGAKANLTKGTIIGGYTYVNTAYPGNQTDYSVIDVQPGSSTFNLGSSVRIINNGQGPDVKMW